MGGYRSGRYERYGAKRLVEHVPLVLDVFKFVREGIIGGGNFDGLLCLDMRQIRLAYREHELWLGYTLFAGGEVEYRVQVCATQPYFGGDRYWWRCPKCERRCAKLYLPSRQRYFLCRECSQLTYASTRRKKDTYAKWWASLPYLAAV